MLFCMPRLCSPKRSLRVRPVCPMYCEERVVLFFNHRLQIAVNHVNQVIRRTRQTLMDSSGLSGIMKGVGGCVVGYELTRSASTIIIQRVIFGGEECDGLVF